MITPPSPCTGSTSTHAIRFAADLLVHRGDRQVGACLAAALGRRPGGATVGIAEGHAVDLGGERPEAGLVRHRLGRERHREQGPAVEGVVEHDDGLTAGEGSGDLARRSRLASAPELTKKLRLSSVPGTSALRRSARATYPSKPVTWKQV